MSTTVQSLAATLLGAGAAAAPPAPTQQAKNILRYARNGNPDTLPVVDGALAYGNAGPVNEHQLRPRVCALVGRGATLRGVAAVLKPLVDKAPAGPALGLTELAKALYVYSAAYLGAPSASKPLPQWRAGLRLPLPLEIDIGSLANPAEVGLVTNRAMLATWAGNFSAADDGRLDEEAAPLPLPGVGPGGGLPAALGGARADALAVLSAWPLLAPAAEQPPAMYRRRLLANPYEVVFELVEVLAELRRTDPATELSLVLDMLDTNITSREQTYVIGWTSAGHAALRRIWDTLTAGRTPVPATDQDRVDAARASVAFGLRLNPRGPLTDWYGPTEYGPDVDPVEPPLDGKGNSILETRSGKTITGITVMVLGREVPVGTPVSLVKTWLGPNTGPPRWALDSADAVVQQIRAAAFPAGTPAKQQACLDIVTRIAGSEGGFETVQASDGGLVSVGVQQWILRGNDEQTVLLHRFRKTNPEHYDLLIGGYGLQPRIWAPQAGGGERPAPVPAADIAAANPYEGGAVSDYGEDFASYVALDQVPRGAARGPLPLGATRTAFFGGQGDTPTKRRWCARLRLAALYSLDWNVIQLQTAVFRFQRLLDDYQGLAKMFTVPSGGVNTAWAMRELFSSQFAVAAVFDQHINAPGWGPADIRTAIGRAVAYGSPPVIPGTPPDPDRLSVDFLVRLSVDFLAARRVYDKGKTNRDGRIVGQFDKGLSGEPGSFQGW